VETYRIENLTFSYPNRKNPVLDDVSLSVAQGDFIILCGASGCGKTTLLRQLKPQIAPHGTKSGAIVFEGATLENMSLRTAAAKIGFVMQSPENQMVTDKVWHELAFGLESLGLGTAEIRLRVAEMASFFGIGAWFHQSVAALSGGQKQLLALASVMAMQPSVLILDEPTSQLDPIAAGEFLNMIGRINRELGVTVILTEHRLEDVFHLCSCAYVMDNGRIIAKGSPGEVGLALKGNHGMFLAMPTPMRVWAACEAEATTACPITVNDGAKWLNGKQIDKDKLQKKIPERTLDAAVTLTDVWFKYEKKLPDVIKGLNFTGHYGEITAILGGNGTGKTTMLSLIAGLNTPYRGNVYANANVYVLPQNPQALFVGKTVLEDLNEISQDKMLIQSIVNICWLDGFLDSHPYDLSGGEQQRAALAKVLLLQPKILLLDEPTKGLDAEYKQSFAAILHNLKKMGTAIIMVSHDIEFCAEYADRCALFFDGDIITENTPQDFFGGNSFYTTGANRMARHVLPNAITAADIILAIGGQPPSRRNEFTRKSSSLNDAKAENVTRHEVAEPICKEKTKLSKRTITAAAMILFTIPATIYWGIHFFDDRQFYFISSLIILQTMLPFALVYEGRKPQARELVIIAVLCAMGVAGRAAFFMLPQFKPVLAIVIISGVAFGGEVGFLVGAMTAFVSNMYFGQGPWTPWQMFAFGIIGFLSGVLFRKGRLSRRPIPLSIFGGFATFVIYGGIMNPAGVLIHQPNPTIEMVLLAYMHGIPFDIVHAVATVTFLMLISRPMLEKLDRIKVKFGLMH